MKIVITVTELYEKSILLDAVVLLGRDLYDDEEVAMTPEQAVKLGLIEEGERW